MSEKGIISTYESGVDLVVEWKIDNFFNLPEPYDVFYRSPDFSFGGERWYLSILLIDPNGSSGSDSSGHVDLGLCKCYSGRSRRQSFSLSLKTAEGEKYNEQHYTKDFQMWISDCHPLIRFIQRSDLTRRRYELVPDGVLTVVCTMKSSTSAGSATKYFPKYYGIHVLKRFIPRSELSRRRSDLVPDGALTVICKMKSSASAGSDSNTASASNQCCHCKITFNADSLSSHRKKCMRRSIKCPDCLEVVVLRTWIDEHECQQERPEGEACASESSTSPYEKKVVQDLKEFFLQKEDCDVIIKVKGSEIPAHRFILKARSPVFASTFRHNMKESATGVVEIEDCEPAPFSDFLRFLYCGDVGMISQENVFSLFTLADKYEVMDLKAKCVDFMKKNLTVAIFCETITLALQHSETELIALATDFFVKNAEEILQTDKWQTFVDENPKQSNELFVKFVKSVKHSNT